MILNSLVDGPYDIEVVAYDDSYAVFDIITGVTGELDHTDFESAGEVTGNYRDSGLDTNANGFYDELVAAFAPYRKAFSDWQRAAAERDSRPVAAAFSLARPCILRAPVSAVRGSHEFPAV